MCVVRRIQMAPREGEWGGLRRLKPETYFDKVFVKKTRKALVDVFSIPATED